ncbi:RimK family alpha-L-glutamate ligase [Embleya sp. NPDC059259]|uniref:ATP-grasp domain-containing protein n=1 Tax=unclassified Embleya TaxID=2699296 RepID=UPI0036A52B13
MALAFLVEEHYRLDGMPLDVVRQLDAWGHHVDVVRPGSSLIELSDLIRAGSHDAWVLKTVSGGPGLSMLDAAAALGLTTINDARAIRSVRDKAVAAVIARAHGLPMPVTWFAAVPELLASIPADAYPLVVKPAGGSSGRAVHLVSTPEDLVRLGGELAGEGPLLAQVYVPNSGKDIKVYAISGEFHATVRRSPLHPGHAVRETRVPLSSAVAALMHRIGEAFGLDLFGVDVIEGPDGPMVVDINDFPSFRCVPDGVARVARAVLDLAAGGRGVGTGAAVAASLAAVPSVAARTSLRSRAVVTPTRAGTNATVDAAPPAYVG